MNRARTLALLAALTAAACSRPPKGMRRLDAGDLNHEFRLDRRRRHLFYIEGGDLLATRLGVVNLDTGRRSSYRFSPESIVAIRPSLDEDAVTVAVQDESEADDGTYELLKVDADTGRVLLRKPSAELSKKDLAGFGGAAALEARAVGDPRPGLESSARRAGRRSLTFFATPTEPKNVTLAPGGKVYASYMTLDGSWRIEEFDPKNGARRIVASFPGRVESMASAGLGLAVLRRAEGSSGPRLLAMVDAAGVELELPWSNGDSEILGADTGKRLLYIRMDEGDSRTCWAVHFDQPALRAASAYLTRARAPNVPKLTATDVVGLVVVGGMLAVLAAFLAAAGS